MNTLNAKNKPFFWSYSALNNYETCPLKYAHASFYCTTPFQQSEASMWGNRVHKAGEMFLKGIPHPDTEALLPVEPYVTAMMRSGCKILAELEITLTKDFVLTGWFAKDAWLRVKVDVVILKDKGESVMVYDFKTGKSIRENPDQLNLCAAALAIFYPKAENFDGKYIWTAHKAVTDIKPLSKADIPEMWENFLARADRMNQAWDNDCFPAKPSGLCPWCQVKDCKQRRGEMRP